MRIVIDISKDVYYRCKNERIGLLPFDVPEVCYAIQNGKVLPKHGDLKDSSDEMIEEIEQIVAEEKINDPKWALGLKYSLHVIRKYIGEDEFHSKHCPVQPTIPPMPKERTRNDQ